MNNVTSTIQDRSIIELAKQNYEKQQRNKFPSIVVDLPSKGLIYPESSPLRSGTIEMRYMTAYDEDILTNSTYIKNGIIFDKLLESLITTSNINVDDISPIDREALIISARIHGYGNMYPVTVTDPSTDKQIDKEIDLSKLKFREFNLQSNENGEFDYVADSISLKFRFLTIGLTKNIDPERAISDLMLASIQEINGNRDKNYIADYLKYEMRAGIAKQFRAYLNDNMPGIDFSIEIEGENGGTFTAGFQLGTDLFWF